MTLLISHLAAILTAGCTVGVPSHDLRHGEPATSKTALTAYARVLEKFVDDRGAVDFVALAQDRMDLDSYVRFVAMAPFDSFSPGDERLAHFINSYNALSMFNVVESGIPQSHAGWNKIVFFVLRSFVIGGRELSLYSYENDVIRRVGDPRIHFALNCSAVSCPTLPRRPFAARDLQETLDGEARKFFSSSANLSVDSGRRIVHVSELLRFYREDFGTDDASLIAFANRYVLHPIPPDFAVRFIPYNWTVANSRDSRAIEAMRGAPGGIIR